MQSNGELKKRYLGFQHFLSMNRQRNKKNLVWWAMVETLSQIARGIPKIASYTSVMSRYALTYSTVLKKLNMLTPVVREYNK